MANRRRIQRRRPRMSGPASDCLVIRDGEVVGSFTPKPKELRYHKVVQLENGKLIVRITDL